MITYDIKDDMEIKIVFFFKVIFFIANLEVKNWARLGQVHSGAISMEVTGSGQGRPLKGKGMAAGSAIVPSFAWIRTRGY